MFRAFKSITCAVCFHGALSACDFFGRDIIAVSPCYDLEIHDFSCCDPWTPRDHPKCLDGGADASTDASSDGEADAGADDGGPPAEDVCPWVCTFVGGAGFGPFPSYVSFGNETDPLPKPLEGFMWRSW